MVEYETKNCHYVHKDSVKNITEIVQFSGITYEWCDPNLIALSQLNSHQNAIISIERTLVGRGSTINLEVEA